MPTRGGLTPAKVINLSSGDEVACMFNPFEYTLSKNNSWALNPQKGKNTPGVDFQGGGSQDLALTLYFDTLPEKGDVSLITNKLWKMMQVDEKTRDSVTKKSIPPEVAFEWNKFYFKAVLTAMTQKFTLFLEDGTPVRCEVAITLKQYIDIDDYKTGNFDIEGLVKTVKATTAVVSGQRLDNVMASAGKVVAEWREIAAANNIDNPRKLPKGQPLSLP